MNELKESKCTLSSSTLSTYRLKCCHLRCGEDIANIELKEKLLQRNISITYG